MEGVFVVWFIIEYFVCFYLVLVVWNFVKFLMGILDVFVIFLFYVMLVF